MKKIISATFFIAISIFATGLFAQEMDADQLKNFQTDNLQNLEKVFTDEDYNKCFNIKAQSLDLLTLSVHYDKKNNFNFLLTKTKDMNRTCGSDTALMTAAKYGRTEIAKELLKKGAKKSLKNSYGETAKDIAVKNKNLDLAKIL